jgi:PAS domain S-box-containing protein
LCAAVFAARFGGLGPAAIAAAAGAVGARYAAETWNPELRFPADAGVAMLGFYALACGAAIVAIESLRRSCQTAQEAMSVQARQEWLHELGDGVVAADRQGTITLINRAAQKLTGWSSEEALGRKFTEVLHISSGPDREPVRDLISWVERPSGDAGKQAFLIARNGAEIPIDYGGAPLRNSQGRVIGAALVVRDISARRKAEELRSRLAAIVDSSEDAIIGKDLDGIITSWNRGAEKLYGYSSEEVVGRCVSLLMPEERKDELPEIMSKIRRREPVGHHETVRIDKHGRRLDVSLSISPIHDAAGHLTGASAIARDISGYRKAEAEREELLRRAQEARSEAESERERIHKILETIREGFLVVDRDLRCLYVNERAAAFARKSRRQMLGAGIWDGFAELQGTKFADEVGRTAISREPAHFEHWYAPFNEWLEVDCYPADDGGLSIFLRDISGRKQAEQERLQLLQEIQRQRERIDNLVSTVPGVVWEASGSKDSPFSTLDFVSSHVEDLLGYPVQEWLEKPNFWLSVVHPEDRAQIARDLPDIYSAGKGTSQFRWIGRDGRSVWVQAQTVVVFNSLGHAVGLRGVCMDISERKRAEREREHVLRLEQELRSEAEAASRSKDEFLATVSHELRTPLNAMLGWARMLRSGKLDAQAADRAIETIERNARSQAQLIDDLLDVSRIISGKLKLEVFMVELSQVIEAAIDSVRLAAQGKDIQLEMELESGAGPISGDPDRLQQIVWNLLSNAIKFTPRGGKVRIDMSLAESAVQLRVSDTGKGIRPEFLPHVFDPFRQGDGGTARLQGGLGLGLSIVRHLVELHGGTVKAESDGEGKGATFTVSLPIISVRYPGYTPASTTAGPPTDLKLQDWLEHVRVLIVDDEQDARELISLVLQKYGAETDLAKSAGEALAKIQSWRPDVLLADVGMPGEDGYSLIRRVRALGYDRGGATPAVALTAYARAEDRTRALSAGFDMHLAKPVEPVELASIIAKLHHMQLSD